MCSSVAGSLCSTTTTAQFSAQLIRLAICMLTTPLCTGSIFHAQITPKQRMPFLCLSIPLVAFLPALLVTLHHSNVAQDHTLRTFRASVSQLCNVSLLWENGIQQPYIFTSVSKDISFCIKLHQYQINTYGSTDFRDHWYWEPNPFDTGEVWHKSQCLLKPRQIPSVQQSPLHTPAHSILAEYLNEFCLCYIHF